MESYRENDGLSPAVINVFNQLDTPICQTLNDIFYWITEDNATEVLKIKLTDSDLHHRGVGVCIVTYKNVHGEKKAVVKPEDKTFEKTVYGGNESLAGKFNAALADGALGSDFSKSKIGSLDIRTSPENKYGSAMEFFKHRRFDKINNDEKVKVDKRSVESLIAFASLLGLETSMRKMLCIPKFQSMLHAEYK